MSKQFSKEQQTLHKVWRAALTRGKVELPFESPAEATRFRFALYNAVKAIRTGAKFADPELTRAIEECTILAEGAKLIVQRKDTVPGWQTILDAVAEEGAAPETPTEPSAAGQLEEISASLARVMQNITETSSEQGKDGVRVTPYYRREG